MHKLKSIYLRLSNSQRLHNSSKPILALTGGIASGKSSAASYMRKLGVPVIDADKLVHEIYAEQATFEFVQSLLPAVIKAGEIDFKALRSQFFSNSHIQNELENFLYQRLPEAFHRKLSQFDQSPFDFVVYDVPLLFEKKLVNKVDLHAVVYCSAQTQLKRLMSRDKISRAEAEKILESQISLEQKRAQAQFVISNINSLDDLEAEVDGFLELVTTAS